MSKQNNTQNFKNSKQVEKNTKKSRQQQKTSLNI